MLWKSVRAACLAGLVLAASLAGADLSQADMDAERAAFEDRIAALANPDVRALLQPVPREIAWIRLGTAWDDPPLDEIAYVPDPLAWIADYPSIDDMGANYVSGLLIFTNPNVFRGDATVRQPFDHPFRAEMIWSQVVLADGSVLAVTDDPFGDP